MQPYKATIYIYADDAEQVAQFEKKFYDFVSEKRSQGIAVTADKMSEALARFKDNFFLNKFLK